VYSVISYSVSLRAREIGVRMALGARNQQVVSLILSQGMRMTMLGLALGLMLTLLLSGLIAPLLYGVSPHDPMALAFAVGSLVIVTLLACVFPAWRAARTDPSIALRAD
jgi:ABC-type antimicrobial peptide transport system permease subunit